MFRKIRYLPGRFISEYQTYINNKLSWNILLYFIDYVFALILYGASVNDYFAFSFYKLRPSGRNEYITYRRYKQILNKCNKKDKIQLFRDKSLFYEKYSEYLHRPYLDLNKTSEEELLSFISRCGAFFVKEVRGFRGKSVWFYQYDSQTDFRQLFIDLKSNAQAHYIVEGKIIQNEELAAFHPNSVNTIRVVTIYNDVDDKVNFMFAKLRMGNGGAHLDNTHAGGISGDIDVNTGVIITPGYSVSNRKDIYIYHPSSHKQIVGFKIPYWEECKDFIEKVARITPEIRYVGWDVVLLPSGEFALIEANDNADHDGQQVRNKGLWKDYKTLLNKLSSFK